MSSEKRRHVKRRLFRSVVFRSPDNIKWQLHRMRRRNLNQMCYLGMIHGRLVGYEPLVHSQYILGQIPRYWEILTAHSTVRFRSY
jgi:hypothetical protein